MLYEMLKPDFIHKDDRGLLTQLVHEGYRQINVITSALGAPRGGHYHKLNTEAFYIISGAAVVSFSKGNEACERRFAAGDFFCISPYVCHWFLFESETVLVSMYSQGVELGGGEMDIFTCSNEKGGKERGA